MGDYYQLKGRNQGHRSKETFSNANQAVKYLTAAAIGAVLLFLSGLTVTGTVISLVVATPLLVIFSPVLVPAAVVIALVVGGFALSGMFGIAAITAFSWIYGYMTGKHPPGSDQLDYAGTKLADTARDVKERAKEYGQYVQHKAQEATQGS